MRPIKAKDLIVSTAMENNLPVDVVTEIIRTYWKEVRASLSDLRYPRVHVSNLGDFTLKHWAIEEQKNKIVRVIERLKDNPRKVEVVRSLQERLELVCKVEEQYKEEVQRKDFIKTHKKLIANAKPNIQKQETDIRRNKK